MHVIVVSPLYMYVECPVLPRRSLPQPDLTLWLISGIADTTKLHLIQYTE